MKNNQYFALLSGGQLITGKVRKNDYETRLLSNDPTASRHWGECDEEDWNNSTSINDEDPIAMFEEDNITGFTIISKARYEELQASKKVFNAFAKELKERNPSARFLNWEVRKIGDYFVFGCGAVKLTKAELKGQLKLVEEIRAAKIALEEAEKAANDAQEAFEDAEDTLETLKSQDLDESIVEHLDNESIDIEDIDKKDLAIIQKLLG